MTTLLMADDHPLYRDALRSALTTELDDVVVLEASDMNQTIDLLNQEAEIDLLLLDLHMPGSLDLFGLIHIRKLFPALPVAVISGLEDKAIINKVIEVGALGFVPKTTRAADIARAVGSMLMGDVWLPTENLNSYSASEEQEQNSFAVLAEKVATLTPSQYKVLCLLREGLLNKQIGYHLGIAEKTVKAHVTSVFSKLGINNRTQAVLIANQLKLEPPVDNH
jgi:DNA-binding NarL/FixJ family response regulator